MNKSLLPSRMIWLVEIEPVCRGEFYKVLPKEMRRGMKRFRMPDALLLLKRIKPLAIFLEGPPGKTMQNAMAQISHHQPSLSVFVISSWQNTSEMGSWFSRYFVEMARSTAPVQTESVNIYRLSARELDILRFMVKGLIKKEIAQQFSISYHTVDNHERNIFRKMNVHNRSAAVAKALIERIC